MLLYLYYRTFAWNHLTSCVPAGCMQPPPPKRPAVPWDVPLLLWADGPRGKSETGFFHIESQPEIHPGRLTWNIIMEVWKIIFLSKWLISRFHVNLPGCNPRTQVVDSKTIWPMIFFGGGGFFCWPAFFVCPPKKSWFLGILAMVGFFEIPLATAVGMFLKHCE